MKSLSLFFLVFSFFAMGSGNKDEPELELQVDKIKAREIENSLRGQVECDDAQDVDQCIEKAASEFDLKQLEDIAKDISGNASFKLKKGRESDAIREFMRERIRTVVMGETLDKNGKVKDGKTTIANHDRYIDLYQSQLGNNLLVEMNSYCLNHISINNINFIVHAHRKNNEIPAIFDNTNVDNINKEPPRPSTQLTSIKEIEKRDSKKSNELSKKILEFQNNADESIKKSLAASCINLIPIMCDYYTCNTADNFSGSFKENCEKLGVKQQNDQNKNGKIACSYKERLSAYQKTLKAISDQKEAMNDAKISGVKFQVSKDSDLKVASMDSDKVLKATTIGSRDLTEGVDSFKDSEEMSNMLEECKGKTTDAECSKYAKLTTEEDEKNIESDHKVDVALHKRKLELLSEDTEKFSDYLKRKGLDKKYGDIENLDPNKLKEIAAEISNDYKSRKEALKERLLAKFKRTKSEDLSEKDDVTAFDNSIEEKKKEVEENKDYHNTLYSYSNLVSSYLTASNKETGDEATYAHARKSELDAMKKHSDEELASYENYFKDEGSSSNASSNQDFNFLNFVDNALGNTSDDKEN